MSEMSFSDMVTQSVFARAMAIIIVSLTCFSMIIVLTADLLMGREVPGVVWGILGTGFGTGGTLTAVNFGVLLQPMPPRKTAPTTTTGVLPPVP